MSGFLECSRVGTIQNNEPFGHVWIVGGKRPGHTAAPIMTDNNGSFGMKGAYKPLYIPGEPVNMVMGYAGRLVALVVASHVRCHDREMLRQEPGFDDATNTRIRETRAAK